MESTLSHQCKFQIGLIEQVIIMNSSIGVVESRQQERRKLKEMINRDDFFDVWVRGVISHAPVIYVFLNITLLIWVAQSIFSSQLKGVPNSIYLVAPLLTTGPLNNLVTVAGDANCPQNSSILTLKTIPTIRQPSIFHKELTVWGNPGIRFCSQRLSLSDRYQKKCPPNTILCSGYCAKNRDSCPITGIKVLTSVETPKPEYKKFLSQGNKNYYFTREENPPLVSFISTFSTKCANDEHYTETFPKEEDYWKSALDCGAEGTISSFFTNFDTMETNTFLQENKVPMTVTDSRLAKISIGSVEEFILSTNPKEGCSNSQIKSQNIQPFLQRSPVAPQFTQSLLIIAFILLVAEICWLIAYYCFQGFKTEKNVFVVLISIIELVIISFIYSQNQELFYIQELSATLARCLKQSLPAMNHWHFGIESPQAFKMVIFINAIFLGLFLSVYLLNQYCFRELRRRQLGPPNSDFTD